MSPQILLNQPRISHLGGSQVKMVDNVQLVVGQVDADTLVERISVKVVKGV